jgi:hypothetical protein
VTKAGKMLNEVSDRLAIMELACMSLSRTDTLSDMFSVREKNWCAEDYSHALSKFLGETLRLTMDCQVELDKNDLALQCNVQESSEKKGA